VSPTGAANLFISDSIIADNGDGITGGGIQLQPGVGGSIKAVLRNVQLHHNPNSALRIDSTNGAVSLAIENSSISGSSLGLNLPGGAQAQNITVTNSLITFNTTGISASGAATRVRVGNTTITANGTGVSVGGGAIVNTYNDNRLDGNGVDGAFSQPPLPPH